ncbi:right-handed parallel beta-helix repeat-containing protein, partial [Candidatus Vampirococcus lugosii]
SDLTENKEINEKISGSGDLSEVEKESDTYFKESGGSISSGASDKCDITVKNGENIQNAIDDAQADYVICVESGTYKENLIIDKEGIALIGIGTDRPVLDGVSINEHGIFINNFDNIEIKNFEIKEFGQRGIYAEFSNNILIDNVYSHNNNVDGIRVTGSKNISIRNSKFEENANDGIGFYSYGELVNTEVLNNGERGIYHASYQASASGAIEEEKYVKIKDNKIIGNSHALTDWRNAGGVLLGVEGGIYNTFINTISVEVENNEIKDNYGSALTINHINGTSQSCSTVRGFTFCSGEDDGPIYENSQSTIKNNIISGTKNHTQSSNTGFGDGIYIDNSYNLNIDGNIIFDNEESGIRVKSNIINDTIEIKNNSIKNNNNGLYVPEKYDSNNNLVNLDELNLESNNTFENNNNIDILIEN